MNTILIYIFIGIIVFFVLSVFLWNKYQRKKGTFLRQPAAPLFEDVGCCGQHETCEKDSLIAAFSEEPEYFDDEELDGFSGRDAENYSEEETEEFREIFYSVLDDEKPQWIRSLQLRNIALPNQIKDEVLMIIHDLRNIHSSDSQNVRFDSTRNS